MDNTISLFKKYNEIENTYRDKAVEYTVLQGLHKGDWIALEKVHGANFSFITDGTTIHCAKRTSILTEEDDSTFHNYKAVRDRYVENILAAFRIVKERFNPELQVLRIFGELFGGSYPVKNLDTSAFDMNDVKCVHKGVWYCPHNDFYGFDIHADSKYLPHTDAIQVFRDAGFRIYAEPLFIGSFEEAMQFNHVFESTIPAKFGLPLIPNNIAEGLVIKPNETVYWGNGARAIFKKKTDKFTEKKPSKPKNKNNDDQRESLPEAVQELIDQLERFFVTARLENVISKVGEVSPKDSGKLIGLLSQDALAEFKKDWNEALEKLPPPQQKMVTKSAALFSSKIVKSYFINES